MAKEEAIKVEGKVVDSLPNAQFKIELNGKVFVIAMVCGKMRKNNIKVLIGDLVEVELSPYDLTKGRIVKRK